MSAQNTTCRLVQGDAFDRQGMGLFADDPHRCGETDRSGRRRYIGDEMPAIVVRPILRPVRHQIPFAVGHRREMWSIRISMRWRKGVLSLLDCAREVAASCAKTGRQGPEMIGIRVKAFNLSISRNWQKRMRQALTWIKAQLDAGP